MEGIMAKSGPGFNPDNMNHDAIARKQPSCARMGHTRPAGAFITRFLLSIVHDERWLTAEVTEEHTSLYTKLGLYIFIYHVRQVFTVYALLWCDERFVQVQYAYVPLAVRCDNFCSLSILLSLTNCYMSEWIYIVRVSRLKRAVKLHTFVILSCM